MISSKQGSTIKKYKFYFQGKQIEIAKQYTYLGFTFISSSKKHKDIENRLKKASRVWFAMQRLLFRSKKRHVTLIYTLLKQLLSQLHFALVKAEAIVIKKAKLK